MTTARSLRITAALAAATVLAMTGCAAQTPTAAPGEGGLPEASTAVAAPIATLDPTMEPSGVTLFPVLYRPLVDVSDYANPSPSMAQSWSVSDDGLTWTFTLDTSRVFHNGETFGSDDVLFSWERMLDASSPHAGTLSSVASIDAPAPETFIVTLKSPNPSFLAVMGNKYVIPKDYFEEVGADAFATNPIGSGPYEFDSALEGGGMRATLWADYPDAEQQYSAISFVPVPSPQLQIAGIQTGTLNVISDVTPSQVETLTADSSLEIHDVSSGQVSFLAFNPATRPLDDVDFRRGISLAIDREALVKTILSGHGSPAGGLFPEPTLGYDADLSNAYDPDEASALIEASGYDGSTIDLTYPTSRLAGADSMARAMQQYLSDVGVSVNLVPLEYSTFSQQWAAGQIEGMYMMQYFNGVDPETLTSSLLAPGSRATFTDGDVDAAVALTRSTTGEERIAAVQALDALVTQEAVYYAPLVSPSALYATAAGLPFVASPFALDLVL